MAKIPADARSDEAEELVAGDDDALIERSPREPLWRHMLGGALRERRNDLGETLDEVATRAGVSPQYLSEIERGLKEPSSEIIAAVSGALDATLLDLTLDVARSLVSVSPPTVEMTASQASFVLAA